MIKKNLPPQTKLTFEDCFETIKSEVEKRRPRWQLTALPWMDYDDVSIIIITHISKKWDQWDQSRPLIPWISKIIHNQTSNLIRNNYKSFSRPCLDCPANQGDNYCSIYGLQGAPCPEYIKWTRFKKNAHDIKLALPIVNHEPEVFDLPQESLNIERTANEMHKKMKTILLPLEWKVYKMLFIEERTEDYAAEKLGYKTSEKNRKAGYRTIYMIKKKIIEKAKELINNDEIDFYK